MQSGFKQGFVANKTKILAFERNEKRTERKISVNGKILEQIYEVVYLGSMFSKDGRYEMDVQRRIAAGLTEL